MTIHRLSKETIGQISAGEVVERPAAVVKELVENAVDADARRIDVVMDGGGTALIEVRDDGFGIPFGELELAVERNATSKLSRIDDLASISTLGFRGEALASIASVADVSLQSACRNQRSGGEIRVQYGQLTNQEAIALDHGTVVRVRQLFDNVPARQKFLRKPRTEIGYAQQVVSAYALAYPNIAFSFSADGNLIFSTHGSGDRIDAAVHVWGLQIAEHLVIIEGYEHNHTGYNVAGIVSLPTIDRANRQYQFLFVGGRLISSRQLSTAFEQAYHTLLMLGRHPLGCIVVETPPGKVDVNVHPTKREVRFEEERLVFALLQRSVRATLLIHTSYQPVPTVLSSPIVASPPDPAVQRHLRLANPSSRVSGPGFRTDFAEFSAGMDSMESEPLKKPATTDQISGMPVLRVLGQVSGMFVIAEGPDGLYLIDQHAAHERILYEQVLAEYQSRRAASQTLIEPAIVELTASQEAMFEQCQEELAGFGFEVSQFGSLSVSIRAVPAILKVKDPASSLLIILDELIEGGRGDSRLDSLAISAACHGSIRAGQPLSLVEMRQLVVQLEACSSPMACGHGRPTIIKMTADELSKQFSRR